MGKTKSPIQPKERRVANVNEVVLGFGKKENVDEARRCPQCAVAGCLPGCPLGIDIPGFIRFLREDDAVSALARIRLQNPFPAICGRICPAPCENACIFYEEGSAISIRLLERYAADVGKVKLPKDKPPVLNHRKVSIVGSGPSGMSAAYYLAQGGYTVTIYEAMSQPGGMLRYGVPEFRLPTRILDEQFAHLTSIGVRIITNVFVGRTVSTAEIFSTNQAAILLAVGAGIPNFTEMKGHDLGGVYYATEMLMKAQAMSKNPSMGGGHVWRGNTTVVIGNSNAAFDAARLSLRNGQKVILLHEGIEEQMHVHEDDLMLAQEEGIEIIAPAKAMSFEGDDQGCLKEVHIKRLSVVEEDGKLLVKEEDSEVNMVPAQTVIIDSGNRPNTFIRQHLPQLKLNDDGSIWIDEQTGLTSVDKVFAAGNATTGAGNVVDAIKNGKDAARRIMEFVKT